MYWYLLGENLYWSLLGPEGLRLTICCSCRSPERVRNPHLRAKLAETLEALIPVNRSQNSSGLLSPSSVNMVCIRNVETCADYQPLPKILPRLLPQSLSLSAIVCFTRRLFVVSDHFRVLSRIYLLGEKSPVANGNKIPSGGPRKFWKWICTEMQSGAFWDIILRNVTVCALNLSHLDDFSDKVTYIL